MRAFSPINAYLDRKNPLAQGLWLAAPLQEDGGQFAQNLANPNQPGRFVNPGSIAQVNSPFGKGLSLTPGGVDTYVSFPNIVWKANMPASISYWVNGNGGDSSSFGITRGGTSDRFQAHNPFSGTLHWDYGNVFGSGRLSISHASYTNKWTHFVLVSSGPANAYMRIYANGILVASSASSGAPSLDTTGFSLGQWDTHRLTGLISNFCVWERAITAQEVQQLYVEPFAYVSNADFKRLSILAAGASLIPGLTLSVSDTLLLSDSLAIYLDPPAGEITATISDTLSMADSLALLTDCLLQVSDTLALSVSVQVFLSTGPNLELVISDTLTLSDAITIVLGYGLSASDTLSLSVLFANSLGIPLSFTDSLNAWADGVTMSLNQGFAASDTLSMNDAIALLFTVALEFDDSLSLSDNLSLLFTHGLVASDALSLSVSVATGRSSFGTISDTLSMSVAVQVSLGTQVTTALTLNVADTFTMADALTTLRPYPMQDYLRRRLNDVSL